MKRLLPLLLLPALAAADNLVSYTGTFTETDHPTLSGAHVVTLTTDGTLSVPADLRLLRVLVVGGGGAGGFGGGGGGQVVDWAPEEPARCTGIPPDIWPASASAHRFPWARWCWCLSCRWPGKARC